MDALHPLIDSIYAAAEEPEAWTAFLEMFADSVRAAQTVIIFHDRVSQVGSVGAMIRTDPEWVALYESHYARENFYLTLSAPSLQSGTINASHWFIEDAAVEKMSYYAEYLRPQSIFHSADCVIFHEGDLSANLITMRAKEAGHFEEPEFAVMRALMPHLQRAYRVHRKLAEKSAESALMSRVTDAFATGILFVDSQRRVLHASKAAQRILQRGDGLTTREGVLTARDRNAQHELERALTSITADAMAAPRVIRIGRGEAGTAYVLTVVRAARSSELALPGSVEAILYVDDPDEGKKPAPRILQTLFGVTPAEANLAVQLLTGKSLKELAESSGVTAHTARTHLQQLLAKTGTHRQAELVQLLERTLGRHSAYQAEV